MEFGLRRLNELVDELAGQQMMLYRDVLTSAVQTGSITLGAGSWAAIAPGEEVISATANNLPLAKITMQQYNEIYQPSVSGFPTVFAQDGMSTVYLWPLPNGQTLKLQTRTGVAQFADINTTDYTLPDGWKAALSASLAVRIAPNIMGQIPQSLRDAEAKCMGVVDKYEPAIVGVDSFIGSRVYCPPRLF